ncbi:MAG: class I fructose-bisphosphate aldolase [Candidatus Paceibacterota bacterium]
MSNYFFKNNRAMILAYDHGFEHGLKDFNSFSEKIENIFLLAKKGGFTGIVLHKGLAEIYQKRPFFWRVPLILKLNGKTPFLKEGSFAPLECSVEYAYYLKAKGVGYTIYLGSPYEGEMIREFSKIQEEARKKGMVTIGWFYPYNSQILETPNFSRDACRLALELGADIIKIKYPGSLEELKKVQKTPYQKILIAGGPLKEGKQFLSLTKKIIKLGFPGMVIGRNIFSYKDPFKMAERVKKIIWSSTSHY